MTTPNCLPREHAWPNSICFSRIVFICISYPGDIALAWEREEHRIASDPSRTSAQECGIQMNKKWTFPPPDSSGISNLTRQSPGIILRTCAKACAATFAKRIWSFGRAWGLNGPEHARARDKMTPAIVTQVTSQVPSKSDKNSNNHIIFLDDVCCIRKPGERMWRPR